MNKDTKTKHREMVLRLGKPGVTILDTLTPWDCNLIHMGGCLMGEASELFDAVNSLPAGEDSIHKDDPLILELREEMGDFAFYLVAVRAAFNSNPWECPLEREFETPLGISIELMRLGGHFWDVVKRITIYRKDAAVPDSKYHGQALYDVATKLLDIMEICFLDMVAAFNWKLDDILEENWIKLADTDKGRYSTGSYSDEQAQNRKDKAQG